MDNIEQLKKDNAKLTERLNNAAKFFREQKAQIEALTKENEELKNSPKEEVIDTEKWNKLVAEKENLQKQIEGYENERKSNEAYSDDLNKQCDEYELKIQKLESDIDSKDKAYKVLQDTYNEVFAENKTYKKQLKEANTAALNVSAKFEELKELNNKLKEDLEKSINQIKVTEKQSDEELKKITTARDEWITKYKELEKEIKNISDTHKKEVKEIEDQSKKIMDSYEADIQKQKEEITVLNTQLGETEERYDKLNIQYDKLENEKLAIQSDLDNLQDKYNKLENEYNSLENKTEIYSKSDDVLAKIIDIISNSGLINKNVLSPQVAIKEDNTIHRMGDNMVSGNNIGV